MNLSDVQGFGDLSIKEAFADNFAKRGDLGASFCVFSKGKLLASLWGGYANDDDLWSEDTVANIYSAGKGILALGLQRLIQAGVIKNSAPIGDFIEGLSDTAKAITVQQLLHHQSGLVAFDTPIPPNDLYCYEAMLSHVKRMEVHTELSGELAYSPFIWGWLTYELLRSLDGLSELDGFYAKRPFSMAELVANGVPLAKLRTHDFKALVSPRGSVLTRAAFLNPITQITKANGKEWNDAIIPGANAVASARSLAGYYNDALLAGIEPQGERVNGVCKVLQTSLSMHGGFMRPQKTPDTMFGTFSHGFGHSGMGGSFGFFDTKHQIAVAYVTRSLAQSMFIDERGVALINALFNFLEIDSHE